MKIAIVELESTVKERIQVRKRLAAALAAMLEEGIMRHTPVRLWDGAPEYLKREKEDQKCQSIF